MEEEQTSTVPKREGLKTSTANVPMADLEETVEFVRQIHERGLENASMPEVARGVGFSHASSTPFARKIAAARHFGFLGSRRAELTGLAREYLRPTEEGADRKALRTAIHSVGEYVKLIEQYDNKRINQAMLTNWFARNFSLQNPAASVCARSFVQSLKFAGLISGDEVLHSAGGSEAGVPAQKAQDELDPIALESKNGGAGEQRFVLPLDRNGSRKFTVISPAIVTPQELKRIQDWLSFQLIVEERTPEA